MPQKERKTASREGYRPGIRFTRRYPRPASGEQAPRPSGGVCELVRLRAPSSNREWRPQKKEKRHPERDTAQVFALGEDTHALRLVSKLPDLRAGYVNWILLRRTHLAARVAVPKKIYFFSASLNKSGDSNDGISKLSIYSSSLSID